MSESKERVYNDRSGKTRDIGNKKVYRGDYGAEHVGDKRVLKDSSGKAAYVGNEKITRDSSGKITHIGDKRVYDVNLD
jgi:hypothetical protein